MSVVVVQRPALAIGGVPTVVDPNFANVSLLLGFNGADASTTTIDDSPIGNPIVLSNGAQIDTAQKKFGVSSCLLDGIDDEINVVDNVGFSFGAGQFTLEGWFRWSTIQDVFNGIVGQWDAGASARRWLFRWSTSGTLSFFMSTDGVANTSVSGAWTPTIGVQYHMSVDRDASNVVRVYVDGVVIASGVDASSIYSGGSPSLSIGHYASTRHTDCHVDEFRITKGVARYGGAFTPPSSEFGRV